MRIVTLKEEILPILTNVRTVIENRNVIPVYGHILVNVNEHGEVIMTSTNGVMQVTDSLVAVAYAAGSCTVDGLKLYTVIKNMKPDVEIEITSNNDGRVIIKQARSRYSIESLPASEFPRREDMSYPVVFDVRCTDLVDALNHTTFAAADDDTRPNIMGVGMNISDGFLNAVATDGKTLANYKVAVQNLGESIDIMISAQTAAAIMKIIPNSEMPCRVRASERGISVEFADMSFHSGLINQQMISAVWRVIEGARSGKEILYVDSQELNSTIKRLSAVAGKVKDTVTFTLHEKGCAVTTVNDAGEKVGHDVVDGSFTGQQRDVSFKGKDLINILSRCSGQITLSFQESISPVAIEEYNDDEQKMVYVASPMKG